MKKRQDEITRERLESEGWKFDHRALYRGYYYAGGVSVMKSKAGMEYCRIHTSTTVKTGTYQETIVMARKIA